MKVRKIPNLNHDKKKRVAAYCRVSTNKDEQEESYERQVSYYENFIRRNPQWEFAGIYADRGHSGVSIKGRPEFQRLMADALGNEAWGKAQGKSRDKSQGKSGDKSQGEAWEKAKAKTATAPAEAPANVPVNVPVNADAAPTQERKIDIILVKSISRFARNLVDCDRAIKELKAAGVEVQFEKEHISSFDPSTGFVLSLLSSVAQDESRSISENVRWTYANRFKNGEYNLGNNRIFGYDSVDGKLVPNADAETVRHIFQLFTQGKRLTEIVNILRSEGVKAMRHDEKVKTDSYMAIPTLIRILSNETYVGDKLLQKKPSLNYLTKQPDPNAEHISYYLTDDHEGIIDRETWEKAQAMLIQRQEEMKDGVFRRGEQHPLYGRLFCGLCGAPYKRRTLHECPARGGGTYKAWNCRERQKGQQGNGCKNRTVREEWLLDELGKMGDDGSGKIFVYGNKIEIR